MLDPDIISFLLVAIIYQIGLPERFSKRLCYDFDGSVRSLSDGDIKWFKNPILGEPCVCKYVSPQQFLGVKQI